MISELWNLIKSFKKRILLYEIEVFSLTLSGSFPNLLVRFFCLGIFFAACILLMPFFTSLFTLQLKMLFIKKHEASQKIIDEVNRIADQLGVRVKKVYIAKGLFNAYVRFNTLVLGEELLNKLGPNERKATIAHELGHIKEKHIWLKLTTAIALLVFPLWSWQRLYWPIVMNEHITQFMLITMINFGLLAYSLAVMIAPNWYLEVRADRIATKLVGKASMISALLAIANKNEFELPSEDHPAISERIKIILEDGSKGRLTDAFNCIKRVWLRKSSFITLLINVLVSQGCECKKNIRSTLNI